MVLPNRLMNNNKLASRQKQLQVVPCSRGILMVVVVIVALLLTTTILYNLILLGQDQRQFSFTVQDDEDEENRCHDHTDSEEIWKFIPSKRKCLCPDPSISSKDLRDNQPEWMVHHQTMLNDVIYETTIPQTIPLDIVFLGDSITERWNGTRSMGTRTNFPEFRHSFDTMFNGRNSSNSNAKLHGLLLGSSGDITTELLWHIQNGILNKKKQPYRLQPKVFMVLIGTNDLGRMECSKTTTIDGIITVINYISVLYPTTPIIVHGLLPRSDTYNQGDYYLGRYWQDILYINKELEKRCRERRSQLWHYMDASHIFLTNDTLINNGDDEDISGHQTMINETLMSDSLHPDVMGYNIWGQEIVQKVLQIISQT